MIRTKGEAGTGNIVEAVRHMRTVTAGIRKLQTMDEAELMAEAKALGAPFELVLEIHKTGKLPVVNFAAGGVATPADAALMMQLGSDGVFVGSGIFKAGEGPKDYAAHAKVANAIVQAVTHFRDAKIIAEVSKDLGKPMSGIDIRDLSENAQLARRGW